MRRGFSLLELAIGLTIIGLLIGGVLVGQALIRASELRAVPREVQRYNTALYAFRDKYLALPGDMANAVRFWGAQAGGIGDGPDAACRALMQGDEATGAATCNGNGDRQIDWQESWRLWQHMANAGLIEGSYSGVPASTTDIAYGVAGVNMPPGKAHAEGGYAYFHTADLPAGDASFYPGHYGNLLRFGAGNAVDEIAYLVAEDAYSIDDKMDDASPATGNMRSYKHSARSDCATSDDPASARYDTAAPLPGCNLLFINGF